MNLEHEFTVPVPVDDAWKVLLDVERVAPCMPGATLTSVDGDDFTGTVKVKVGPIQVTYKGQAKFVEKDDAAHRAVIEASGKEARGTGTAGATVTTQLVDQGASTVVQVHTDLNVTGRPAQFGRGVMSEVAAKLIDQFAKCLEDEINNPSVAEAPADSSAAAPAPTPAAAADAQPVEVSTAPAVAPTGAGMTEPAPAPAAPVPPTAPPAPRRTAEAIDLLDVAGGSVLKRLAPVGAVVALLLLIVWRRRSR